MQQYYHRWHSQRKKDNLKWNVRCGTDRGWRYWKDLRRRRWPKCSIGELGWKGLFRLWGKRMPKNLLGVIWRKRNKKSCCLGRGCASLWNRNVQETIPIPYWLVHSKPTNDRTISSGASFLSVILNIIANRILTNSIATTYETCHTATFFAVRQKMCNFRV